METTLANSPKSTQQGNTSPVEFKEPKADTRARAYCYTLNNWSKEEWDKVQLLGDYGCVAPEFAPTTGTPHLQGYFYFQNKKTFSALKKQLPRARFKCCDGNAEQNRTYIFGPYEKDGKVKPFNPEAIEWGEMPKQGKRTDLDEIKNQILAGKKVDEIAIEEPFTYHLYGRTLSKLEDLYLRKKFRTEMTKGIWYHGKTGVGKSHKAFEDFTPETHYVVPNDGGWWDGYTQQETVIINDFRGEIAYNQLLQMVDKWPYSVKRRGREPMPFTSKKVIITSSLPPAEVYKRRNEEDSLDQLSRRFNVIELY